MKPAVTKPLYTMKVKNSGTNKSARHKNDAKTMALALELKPWDRT